MLTYLRCSLFDSPAQTLVNTVNTVGVMGKGVARQFKGRYPDMFKEYKQLCQDGRIEIGVLHLWRATDRWVLNFPTKTTWRRPSKIEFVEAGLKKLCEFHGEMGIASISFPPLGCGNGQLDWADVRPLMEQYLRRLPIQVYIHDKQVPPDFVPEHLETNSAPPRVFEEFVQDLVAATQRNKGLFQTLHSNSYFCVAYADRGDAKVSRGNKTERIPCEAFAQAWTALQTGILSIDQFSGEGPRRYKSYLFSILCSLPYVRWTQSHHVAGVHSRPSDALYFKYPDSAEDDLIDKSASQKRLCLSP